jgi:hypothetical protein
MNKFLVYDTIRKFQRELDATLKNFVSENTDIINALNQYDGFNGALCSFSDITTWMNFTSYAVSTGIDGFFSNLATLDACFDKTSSCSYQTKLDVYQINLHLEHSLCYLLYGQFASSWYYAFERAYKSNRAMVLRVMDEMNSGIEEENIVSPYSWLVSVLCVHMDNMRSIMHLAA